MRTRNRWVAYMMGLLCVAGSASAGTISYNGSFGPRALGFGPQALITLPLFDPSLGVLSEVAIRFVTTTAVGTIRWDNESELPTSVSLGIGARSQAYLPDGSVMATQTPVTTGEFPLVGADSDGSPDFSGGDSVKLVGGESTSEDVVVLTGSEILSFIGSGNFDVLIDSEVDTTIITNGGTGASDLGDESDPKGEMSGTVEVTYTYVNGEPDDDVIPVEHSPEPASIALWGLGGLGTFLLARRRRGKKT